MNGIIDFGNTRGKWAVFEQSDLVASGALSASHEVEKVFEKYGVRHIMTAKVGNDTEGLLEILAKDYPIYELSHQTPLPIVNAYGTPATLGMDRLAGVVGAWAIFPQQAALVIDMGTCITYDFIDASGTYLGGGISPGMRMRAQAMNRFTAKLPMVEHFDSTTPLIGKSTQDCLASGVIYGTAFEIEGHIRAYREGFEIFNTVLCGGDAPFFETKLKAPIFARKELVMIGLNAILNHLLASQERRSTITKKNS